MPSDSDEISVPTLLNQDQTKLDARAQSLRNNLKRRKKGMKDTVPHPKDNLMG